MGNMNNTGNSDAITRAYFDSLLLETRYIDATLPSTEFELFGEKFQTPIMTAALSHLHKICDNAMVEIARGAKEANAVHFVGMGEDQELEDILATKAKTVKIIKPHKDNKEVLRRIEHAVNHGAFAVGMDIDHAFSNNGTYDSIFGLPMQSKTMKELKEFVEASKVPFIVKGVLSAADAEKCVEAGAKGIIVSHHHGMMEYSVPPLLILPKIVEIVNKQIPVFVDCGIESGMDAFKALALGADAVCVGRNLMEPLKEGASGVTKRINELTTQLRTVMARTGMKSLSDINSDVVWHRDF